MFGFGGSGTKSKGKGKGGVFRLLTQRAEPVSGIASLSYRKDNLITRATIKANFTSHRCNGGCVWLLCTELSALKPGLLSAVAPCRYYVLSVHWGQPQLPQ